jgi:hypothetical protein
MSTITPICMAQLRYTAATPKGSTLQTYKRDSFEYNYWVWSSLTLFLPGSWRWMYEKLLFLWYYLDLGRFMEIMENSHNLSFFLLLTFDCECQLDRIHYNFFTANVLRNFSKKKKVCMDRSQII